MPFGPQTNRARRQGVLKLDTGLRLAMAFIIPLVSSVSAHGEVNACSQLFSSSTRDERAPYYDIALERAMTKSVREFSDTDGLSTKDLQYIVEKVYREEEGPTYKLADYYKMTAQERTESALARMVGEKVTHMGLIDYFHSEGILLDNSTLISKITTLNRSPITNMISGIIGATGIPNGHLPILLPDAYMKIKVEDMTVLLLRGLDSKEGREILNKYQISQEVYRGYAMFNRYYTRVAMAVVFVVLWEKGDDFFKEKHDEVLKDLWVKVLEELHLKKGKTA
ncbi:hypothetical protein B9G69_016940 [Bdellovibrio sp. SKB1291214]|uniref:hypothetical protein n=1 Tax=Bdellovibrio sp. SKB1291214 TaxID=1732569 RepID=UPI00223EEAEC|nr:hypothetical protein [Bdellovibrio sp. SKB1291214]UYL08731.1 hypothetical protein B9G69_016940 [Bdellovibrio sp. SKB1291214]